MKYRTTNTRTQPFVPPATRAPLLKRRNDRKYDPKVLPLKSTMKLITTIYQERISASKSVKNSSTADKVDPLPEFVYDFFLVKFGLPAIAENK